MGAPITMQKLTIPRKKISRLALPIASKVGARDQNSPAAAAMPPATTAI